MGKFRQILTELFARDTPIFSFLDDNLSNCQGILTKFSTCINIKEIWFWIFIGQISQVMMELSARAVYNIIWRYIIVLRFYFYIEKTKKISNNIRVFKMFTLQYLSTTFGHVYARGENSNHPANSRSLIRIFTRHIFDSQ